MTPTCAIGLMSGTSADGIDAALVRTDGESRFQFLDFLSIAYDAEFRMRLLSCAIGRSSEQETDNVEQELSLRHAQAVNDLINRNRVVVDVIGFHGHTISHQPDEGFTRQLGDGQKLSDLCDTPVVFDFRSEDLRAGGQGAPLVPLFHQMLFRESPPPCAVVNIGGVANVTWLENSMAIAGDTGPGCGLIDAWIQKNTDATFDHDGRFAAQGTADSKVIAALENFAFFDKPFPKSADRFDFQSISVDHLNVADGAATLCEVTARSICDAILRLGIPRTTWVAGGGAKHPTIVQRLREALGNVRRVEEVGLRTDSLEAECFAWLAVRRMRHLPTTMPSTTGCAAPTCGGKVAMPRKS